MTDTVSHVCVCLSSASCISWGKKSQHPFIFVYPITPRHRALNTLEHSKCLWNERHSTNLGKSRFHLSLWTRVSKVENKMRKDACNKDYLHLVEWRLTMGCDVTSDLTSGVDTGRLFQCSESPWVVGTCFKSPSLLGPSWWKHRCLKCWCLGLSQL